MHGRNLGMQVRAAVVAATVVALLSPAHTAGAQTVLVTISAPQAWTGGFSGEITLTNNAPWTIFDWRLAFDAPWNVTSLWDATLTSHSGAHYVIDTLAAAWNDGDLSPGEVNTFGFVATGTLSTPTSATLNGTPITFNVPSAAPPPLQPAAAPPWPSRVAAPYFDATGYPPFGFVAAASSTGTRHWIAGFVVATSPTDPTPSFGGYYPTSGQYLLPEINALRAIGGDVMVSFGGAAGTEISVAATTAAQAQARYQSVIDAYAFTHIDFDVEGAWVADPPSIARRSQAIAGLQATAQQNNRPLSVWFTLPVLPSGLTLDGINVLASALNHGVVIAGVNIMAMDYGDGAAPNPAGQMGAYAIQAANSTFSQLQSLYASHNQPKSAAQLWKMLGVTPMIGVNDVQSEIFLPSDAQQVVAFATAHDLGLLGFWSGNRDHQCPGGAQTSASGSCSSILQTPFQFTIIFHAFTTGVWEDLGFAKAGSTGFPTLTGGGLLLPGTPATWTLSNVPAGATVVFVAGATIVNAPVLGATLVPSPDVLLPLTAGPTGSVQLAVSWPAGLPFGLPLVYQCGIFDVGASQGLSASNALRSRTP